MSGKVNFSVVPQTQIDAWKKELADSSTTKERKRDIINDWTATRVADAVNRGTKGLEGAADRIGWNAERADIEAQARTTFSSMAGLGEAMAKLEGANKKDIQSIVGRGSQIYYKNAETAYKGTLYPHESFDKNTFLEKATEGVGDVILASGGTVGFGTFLLGGGYYAPAMLTSPSYFAALGVFSLGVGAAATTAFCLYKAGDYVYMKTTLPEMQKFPEAQDL